MFLGQIKVPIQASRIGHGIFVDHFFKWLTQHQFLDGQLLLFARQGSGNFCHLKNFIRYKAGTQRRFDGVVQFVFKVVR